MLFLNSTPAWWLELGRLIQFPVHRLRGT
jgi:hypothetical protein